MVFSVDLAKQQQRTNLMELTEKGTSLRAASEWIGGICDTIATCCSAASERGSGSFGRDGECKNTVRDVIEDGICI
jgi:hypothetical protein